MEPPVRVSGCVAPVAGEVMKQITIARIISLERNPSPDSLSVTNAWPFMLTSTAPLVPVRGRNIDELRQVV